MAIPGTCRSSPVIPLSHIPTHGTQRRFRRPFGNPFQLALLALACAGAVTGPGCARFESHPIHLERTLTNLETRSLASPELREFIERSKGERFPEWPLQKWSFEDLSLAAVWYNPELAVARAQTESVEASTRTASGRLNPTLGLQGGYNFDATKGGMSPWMPGTTLDLPIETAGKRARRTERASHLARAARLDLISKAWGVRAALRSAVIDRVFLERRLEVMDQQRLVLGQIRDVLEQRLRAGAATTQEVSTVRIQLLKLESESSALLRQSSEIHGKLAALLGLSPQSLALANLLPPVMSPVPKGEVLLEQRSRALKLRADIQSALANYEASQSQLQLEIAKQYPDLHLGNGYQWDQGDSKWSFGLTLELPILNRNQGPIAEATARRREAAAQVLAAQARAIAELDRAADLNGLLRHQLEEQSRIQQELDEQTRRVEARRNQGGADRLEVATARMEALTQRLVLLDLEQRLAEAAGLWEAAVQQPAPAPSNASSGPTSFPPAAPISPAPLP